MPTRPEYEEVTTPDFTVGEWARGFPGTGDTTKPIFIKEGDSPLAFTVPVMSEVSSPGYTVPQIIVEEDPSLSAFPFTFPITL